MSGACRACPSQESEAPSGDQWELATFSLDCRKLRISPRFHLCSIGCLGPFSSDQGFPVYPVYGIRAPSTQTGLWVTSVLDMALWPSVPLSPLPLSDKNSPGPDLLLCWPATVLVTYLGSEDMLTPSLELCYHVRTDPTTQGSGGA